MPGDRLTLQDRRQIATGLREGLTYAAIGRRIARPTSTVTREVVRKGGPRGYHAEAAHQAGTRPARRAGPPHQEGPTSAGAIHGSSTRWARRASN